MMTIIIYCRNYLRRRRQIRSSFYYCNFFNSPVVASDFTSSFSNSVCERSNDRDGKRDFRTISGSTRCGLRKRNRKNCGSFIYCSSLQLQQQQQKQQKEQKQRCAWLSNTAREEHKRLSRADEISTPNNQEQEKQIPVSSHDVEMELNVLFRYLELQSFTKKEIEMAFEKILSHSALQQEKKRRRIDISCRGNSSNNNSINESDVFNFLLKSIKELEDKYDPNNQHETQYHRHHHKRQQQQQQQQQQPLLHEYTQQQAQQFLRVFTTMDANENNNNYNNNNNHNNTTAGTVSITRLQFVNTITNRATSVDYKRSWPITLSMLFIGVSVGVTTPAMPFVIEKLQLSPGQYGLIVSAFGLSRMVGNIPCAIFVERYGRKPFLTYSLAPLIAVSVCGIGLATSFEQLYGLRLLTGLGVAALTTASQLMLSDISTPLNRASTLAPVMSAFSAGATLGPAIGGNLVDQMGLQYTFTMIGFSYCGMAIINNTLLKETLHTNHKSVINHNFEAWKEKNRVSTQKKNNDDHHHYDHNKPSHNTERNYKDNDDDDKTNNNMNGYNYNEEHSHTLKTYTTSTTATAFTNTNNDNNNSNKTIYKATQDALRQWKPLISQKSIRNVLIMNGCYWFAFSGAQITLLPLILTDAAGLNMTATDVGKVYMGMSLVQVLCNPIMARYVVDNIGKVPAIVAGCALISCSMAALPIAVEMTVAATNAAAATTTAAASADMAVLVAPRTTTTTTTSSQEYYTLLAPVLGVWALGSSVLSTAPISYMSDHVREKERAQGLAMLRVSGDIGFLLGSSSIGALADFSGGNLDIAMQCGGTFLFTSTIWFAVRNTIDYYHPYDYDKSK